jgi:hypothetical protein
LAEEKRRLEEERRRFEELKKQQVASLPPQPSVSQPGVIGRDGNFIKYATGLVKDTKTGLEWIAGPDTDMTWDQARTWAQSLTVAGGGWRMPTTEELKTLYDEGKEEGNHNMTPLLKTTGWRVWSGKTIGSSTAYYFGLNTGFEICISRHISLLSRAFAIRSR